MKKNIPILIIEDQLDLAEHAKREIWYQFRDDDAIGIDITIETDFNKGLELAKTPDFDVVILDVKRDSPYLSPADADAGIDVYHAIMNARFAPIIFLTALPDRVADLQMPPLVTVVAKDNLPELPGAVRAAIESNALATIREIERQTADILRNQMWTELAPHWDEYTEDANSAGIAQVLLSRLARTLEDKSDQAITSHPSHRYVYPHATRRSPGDILRDDDDSWWVLLTPACDLVHSKADYVLLARGAPLSEHQRYKDWADAVSRGGKTEGLWKDLYRYVLRTTHGKYHFLPAFRDIPDLVIDLENMTGVEIGTLDQFTWVASLASPFAEALQVQYSQHHGRIGVPDLDPDIIKERLLSELQSDN